MRIKTLLAAAVAATSLTSAAPAGAAVSCSMSGQKLTVVATAGSDEVLLTRLPDGILGVRTNGGTPVACTGAAPDMDADGNLGSVELQDSSGGSVYVALDLSNGPLGPGAAGDATEIGVPDLEIDLLMGAGIGDTVIVYGTEGPDVIELGRTGVVAGINLNRPAEPEGGRDADVALIGVEAAGAEGRGGDDILRASGPDGSGFDGPLAGVEAYFAGGDGDDLVVGGASDDSLYGNGGDDVLTSGVAGDDDPFNRFFPGTGDDLVFGTASGGDSVDYGDAPSGVVVDLELTDEQNTRGAGVDKLTEVQSVTGSSHADVLRGDHRGNQLLGGAGDDVLAGRGGPDVLRGEDGLRDVAAYEDAPAGVTVDLGLPEGDGQETGGAGYDSLGGIEGLTGSAFADELRGNDEDNLLDGGAGVDDVWGLGGADRLLVRDGGSDTGACGDGADTAVADAAGVDTLAADCEQVELFVPPVDPGPDPSPAPSPSPSPAPSPSPSPAPAAAPAAPADTSVELDLTARARQRGRAVQAAVGCAAEACSARASGRITIGKRRARLRAVAAEVPAGASAPLRLALPRAVARQVRLALRRGRPVKVRLTVTVVDAAGNRRSAQRTVRLVG